MKSVIEPIAKMAEDIKVLICISEHEHQVNKLTHLY